MVFDMDKYYGKIMAYDIDEGTLQQKQDFKKNLPHRTEFIDSNTADIKEHKPFLFLSNFTFENHYKNNNKLMYHLSLIGVLRDGSKVAVVIPDAPVFFEVRVPNDTDATHFMEILRTLLSEKNIYYTKSEIVHRKPFKLFNIEPVSYIQFSFNTTHQRTKGLAEIRTSITYTDLSGKSKILNSREIETGYDDPTSGAEKYFRQVARMFKFNVAGWNTISKYTISTDSSYFKTSHIAHTFIVSIHNIKNIEGTIDPQTQPEYRDLLFDKTMTCSWDLETYSRMETGRAPMPKCVFEKGKESDVIFMDSMTFRWYWDSKSMLKICITDLPCPPHPDCLIIKCNNQIELIKIKLLLLGTMCPDYITGFNDGQYDWPFIFKRIKAYNSKSTAGERYNPKWAGLLNFLKTHAAVIPYSPKDTYSPIYGKGKEEIKIENGLNYKVRILKVPGILSFDMKAVLTVMYPKAEKFSLNYFLGKFRLPQKVDMPYLTMFKIYRIARYFKKEFGNDITYDQIINHIKQHIINHGESDYMLASLQNEDSEFSHGVHKLTALQILHIYGGLAEGGTDLEGASQIVTYCNYDADSLHDIIRVQNIIPDKRELAKLSYTSIYDSFYRAGGMRVRNLALSYMCEPSWNMVCSNKTTGVKDGRKYPGAYIVPPKKGLYRDHKYIKHARGTKHPITIDTVSPDSSSFNTEFTNAVTNTANIDTNGESDRPSVGLDFASLYPSIMMAYNISADTVIMCPKERDRLLKLGYELTEISFLFGFAGDLDSHKQPILGWAIQHRHPQRKILQAEVDRARSIDPINWTQHINHTIANTAISELKKTTLDQWHEYGMGLFPYILLDLFNKRSQVKKLMDQFLKPAEWLEDYMEHAPQYESLNDEKSAVIKSLEQMLLNRKHDYDIHKKEFYKFRIFDAENILKFIQNHWITGVYSHMRIKEFQTECSFKASYYNTNQLTRKIFMNTFYGESGNQLSAMFLPVVAGGVTTYGQKNIRMVKAYVEQAGFNVLYGDTDSLYICPQSKYFSEVDADYEAGKISRREYWTKMIEITMEVINSIKDDVNLMLMFSNFTAFLSMMYEEVLFPLLLAGKKKYAGVPHIGIVNLSMCESGVKLEDFMKPGRIFIKGMEMVKRGVSAIAKQVSYEILLEAFSLSETRTIRSIVDDKLSDITMRKWDPPLFAKSATYKLPTMNHASGKMNPGNVSVLNFVERMKNIQAQYPGIGIDPPEVGSRFQYIITKKYPWTYDFRGNQKNISMSDQYEYLHAFNNPEYLRICGGLEIDTKHYISKEIIGHFARFILYHPDFDVLGNIDYDNKEAYEAADASARKHAVVLLTKYYNQQYNVEYKNKGFVYKKIHSNMDSIMNTKISNAVGESAQILKIVKPINVEQYLAGGNICAPNMRTQIINHLCSHAKKYSEKVCCYLSIQKISHISSSPQQLLRSTVLSKDSYYTIRYDQLRDLEHNIISSINDAIPMLQKLSALSIDKLAKSVTQIADRNQLNIIDVDEHTKISMTDSDINLDELINDPSLEHLNILFDKYLDLVSVYKQMGELEIFKNSVKTLSSISISAESMPSGFIQRNIKDDYMDFVRRRQTRK